MLWAINFCCLAVGEASTLVFFMLGQSNMEGHGLVDGGNGSLAWLVGPSESQPADWPTLDCKAAAAHREGCDAAGANISALWSGSNWTESPNVWVDYWGNVGGTWGTVANGPLQPGYGYDEGHIGPELGFGFALPSDRPVLLLKCAWGGTSLAFDWRPPSSANATAPVGWCWTNFTAHARAALANLTSVYPGYDGTYELGGVVWHQGWQDGGDRAMAYEYEVNLANLIRDLRTDFGTSLPVSIPVQGTSQGWKDVVDSRLEIIRAQYNVTTYLPRVAAQETRGFYRDYTETSGACDQVYHWNCNAESYFYVGTVAAQGITGLINGDWEQPFINTTIPI
ncbi:hypothetical protein CTAYLR_007162 [Chrysophaeum taylorii]|uniref:Sialate O-acetylesterase domain-containing protein n=1 Tax=Chrysophaeum taylorii TaxID=2483200 RepID=A0AAD7UKM5_9STRA|nr:hypothetical protein CTAYLR_007162 [Chrysophaeum taylorii]